MAKKAKKAAKLAMVCPNCGETSCNCKKIAAGFKLVLGLLVLGLAAGVLSLTLTSWLVGLLLLLMGVMMWTKA